MNIPPPPAPGRVLGLYTLRDAGTFYRLVTPLRMLPSASWACIHSPEPDGVTAEQLEAAETVVIHRFGGRPEDVQAVVQDLRERWGVKRIVLDYDDAMFMRQPVKEVQPRRLPLKGLKWALRNCDGVIVQNERLARYYRSYTDAPFEVVPNLIEPSDWPEVPPAQEQPPVVVLAGSASHGYDWQHIITAMRWLRSSVEGVQIRVLGCPHPEIKQLATDFRPWVDFDAYAQQLAGATIGLCPLPRTRFNEHKSPIKAYEYALAAGAAVIGSPTQYAEVLCDGRGLVVPDDDALGWVKCLAHYLLNPDARNAAAVALRSWVLTERNVRRWAGELTRIYDGGTYVDAQRL